MAVGSLWKVFFEKQRKTLMRRVFADLSHVHAASHDFRCCIFQPSDTVFTVNTKGRTHFRAYLSYKTISRQYQWHAKETKRRIYKKNWHTSI